MKEISCPHKGCSEVFTKSQIDDHVQNCPYKIQHGANNSPLNSPNRLMTKEKSITQQCSFSFIGCPFEGSKLELSEHMEKDPHNHLSYICSYLSAQSIHKVKNDFNNVAS